MAIHKNESFLYLRNLSNPLSQLLADPFSELTRKRQPALLIAATVALLLSAGLAKVKEVGLADIKFELQLPHLATWLAVAITGYLLIAYLVGVWADWAISKAKRWSPLAKIGDVKAAMVADRDARSKVRMELNTEIKHLMDEQSKVRAEIQARRNRIQTRLEEIDAALSSEKVAAASSEESKQLASLGHEYVELSETEIATDAESRDRLHSLSYQKALSESIRISQQQESALAEGSNIEDFIGTFSHLTQVRLAFEIFFPAAYAVFALVWTVLHA